MKVVLLAGGLGTRLSEETSLKPKPMVEIGGMPILWHIMKIYSTHGYNDFVICLGYKGYLIKEYFYNYFLHNSDVTINLQHNSFEIHNSQVEPWTITLVDTGLQTMTGGRIKRVQPYIGNDNFLLTYGDGLSDIDVSASVVFHKNHGRICTVTSVQPTGRFGSLDISGDNLIHNFFEKPKGDGAWVNGGYFVCRPEIFQYLEDDGTVFELNPLQKLTEDRQLVAFKHHGYWKPMDTLRDRTELEESWSSGNAPWKIW
jgi:glucose-1-phosphate cytidylyltransferase